MNKIANSIEQMCNDYPENRFSYELMWLILCRFERESLGADAVFNILKSLSIPAKVKLGDALRSMIEEEPEALRSGYSYFNSICCGTGALADASHFERIIPADWLKLVGRLEEDRSSSGLADGRRSIKGRTVVYKCDGSRSESSPEELGSQGSTGRSHRE